jgi:hypothetical protein
MTGIVGNLLVLPASLVVAIVASRGVVQRLDRSASSSHIYAYADDAELG